MKKALPYILSSVLALSLLVLLLTAGNEKKHVFNERITFNHRDKLPYGTYIAYEGLKSMFPSAQVMLSKKEPGYWDSLSNFDDHQAVLIITPRFDATQYEMTKLISFAEGGNDVFISTVEWPIEVTSLLKCNVNTAGLLQQFTGSLKHDSLSVSLAVPPYQPRSVYSLPGKRMDVTFSHYDQTIATPLGYGNGGLTNFIHLKPGKGNLYLHLAPMAFTNYFILHKDNVHYYEQVLSSLSPGLKKIVWDQYYLSKRTESREPNWISVIMNNAQFRPFLMAIAILLLTIIVYVLLAMRRKQRPIPVITQPVNDSLEFVKTIGRLYHDKGDHRNLARKMATYFLEHVRNRYKLQTGQLTPDFVNNLHHKSGYPENELQQIVQFIRDMDIVPAITDQQLVTFHKQLETFYSNA